LQDTLFDRVIKFHEAALKNSSVKVPKLRTRKKQIAAKAPQSGNSPNVPVSSIINLIIKSLSETPKSKKTEATTEPEIKIAEEKPSESGGYGTIPKNYGASPQSSYIDYAKLFSYLGKFIAGTSYAQDNQASNGAVNPMSSSTGLVSKETMEKAGRYIKYMAGGADLDTLSMVPKAGMSSSEWENFKLWMKLDPVMYRLKVSTS